MKEQAVTFLWRYWNIEFGAIGNTEALQAFGFIVASFGIVAGIGYEWMDGIIKGRLSRCYKAGGTDRTTVDG